MTIQSIAHHVVPASLRDVGTGLYHLAKKDATEEQCQKLVTGAIRVTVAVQLALLTIAATALLPPPLGLIISAIIIIVPRFLDTETSTLALGGQMIGLGLASVATGVSLLARGLFGEAALELIIGSARTGLGWLATRMPKDIKVSGFDVLKERIDDLGDEWGSQLHQFATERFAWNY